MDAKRRFFKVSSLKINRLLPIAPSTCIWNLKLKFQSKLDLCSGNHVVYRQTGGRTDKVNPVYPPPTSLGEGIIIVNTQHSLLWLKIMVDFQPVLKIYNSHYILPLMCWICLWDNIQYLSFTSFSLSTLAHVVKILTHWSQRPHIYIYIYYVVSVIATDDLVAQGAST